MSGQRPKKKHTPSQFIEAVLAVYSLDRWSVDTVFNFYFENNSKLCKVCDCWVERDDLENHIKWHKSEWERIVRKRKKDAEQRRLNALRLRREEKRRQSS